MKKNIIITLFMCVLFSSQELFAIGDFFIAPIANKSHNNIPLKICYDEKYHDYYPSRIFDIDHREGAFIVYNLYVVYLDSLTTPMLKTIQVKIPKEFKGVRCRVGSEELVYSFQTKKSEILVYIPAIEKDTLTKYECNMLYSYSLNEPKLYRLVNNMPRGMEIQENRYIGASQNTSFILYYYNFTRRQKEKIVDSQIKVLE